MAGAGEDLDLACSTYVKNGSLFYQAGDKLKKIGQAGKINREQEFPTAKPRKELNCEIQVDRQTDLIAITCNNVNLRSLSSLKPLAVSPAGNRTILKPPYLLV